MSSTDQQDQMPPGKQDLGLERIIFFSDAVMAIAITLLAVEIQVPEIARPLAATELPRELLSMAPEFASFVISFAIIGVYWLAHHRYYRYIVRYDTRLMLLNLLFLFFIGILPFVTNLLGTYAYLPLANIAYALTAAALGLTTAALWWYAAHDHRLVDEGLDPQLIRATSIRALSGPATFLLSIPFALFSTVLAQIIWGLSPIVSILLSRLGGASEEGEEGIGYRLSPMESRGRDEMNVDPVIARTSLPRDALAGQVAIVTGAGRGIGREAACALAWLGAQVVLAELDPDLGGEAEEAIRREGGAALFVRTDVSDPASVSALARRVHAAYGDASILVNNAIYIHEASVAEMRLEDWDRTMGVNLRGTFLTCQAFLPGMLARRRGTIVNMVSTEAMPGLAAYIATKQGIIGFSQSLALEVGEQGVRVIPFGPGMVDTPGMRSVATGLAPRLGMTEEAFLHVPLHPAFEGLMPAEYAGAATAYLVAALADEFHGEVVTGYTVLEHAGVIEAPALRTPAAQGPAAAQAPAVPLPAQALDLSRRLEEIIAQTGAEFDRLPVFVRPLARRGFKAKAGQSFQDWARTAAALSAGLEQGTLPPNLPHLNALLDDLVLYYEGVPTETARFTRDAEMLQQVTQTANERIALICALRAALSQTQV